MSAARDNQPKKLTELSSVQSLLKKSGVPAISIATVDDGKISADILNLKSANMNFPEVTADARFAAASLSKPVFAFLIYRLIEKGLLPKNFLKMPLHLVLPEHTPFFRDPSQPASIRFDVNNTGRAVTPELVLSHSTGLPNWVDGNADQFTLSHRSNKRFSYSGEGFYYLQRVIEKLTRKSLQQLAQQEIFGPLRMSQSSFSFPEGTGVKFAVGHNAMMEPQPVTGKPNENAGASLTTTAADYARFIVACLEEKNKGFKDFFQEKVLMTEDRDAKGILSQETLSSVAWGLGWGIERTANGPVAFHWGDVPNFKAFVAINLKDKKAIVYFTNSENGLALARDLCTPVVGNIDNCLEYLFKKYNYKSYDSNGWAERQMGVEAAAQGDFKAAVVCFQNALTKTPDDALVSWQLNLMKIKLMPVHPAPQVLKKLEGEYGKLRVISDDKQLSIVVFGKKHLLIPMSDNVYLDNDNKVRIEFKLNKHGLPMLICSFLNGATEEYTLNSAKLKIDGSTSKIMAAAGINHVPPIPVLVTRESERANSIDGTKLKSTEEETPSAVVGNSSTAESPKRKL